MNKAYNLVYSEESGAWVAVSEITKAKGKRRRVSLVAAAVSTLSLFNAVICPHFHGQFKQHF